MSLIRPVIRMCARAALMNQTWAADRVYDSMNTPLADQLEEDAAPYISIYTDEDNVPEFTGKDVYLEPRNLSLTLEIGCAKAVAVAGSSPHVEIPQTDEGLEFIVDIVQTQAIAALIGDPTNAWGELLRKIMLRIIRMPSHRGGSAQAGTRWAARQVVLVCDTVADSPPGVVPGPDHPIMQFIAKAKSVPEMAGVGVLLESVLNNTEAPDWRQAQAWLTLSKEAIQAIGLAPVVDGEEEPQLEAVNISDFTPLPPTLTVSEPEVNPPLFSVTLVSGNGDERDTKVGDVVQVLVNTRAEIYKSAKLTESDISNGSIQITGKLLPEGEHQAFASVQRSAIGMITLLSSNWSEPVTFRVSG